MPKREDLSRSLEINAIWTFDTEFPTIFNKPCTYITFKSAVKHRQLGYGYPRWINVEMKFRTTSRRYFNVVPISDARRVGPKSSCGRRSTAMGVPTP